MNTVRVSDVDEAVALAEQWKTSGSHDWFRGQRENWPVVASLARKSETELDAVYDEMARFEQWVNHTPGLEALAADTDAKIAIAQHYGLPTNFIDFSTEPKVAGFFAADTAHHSDTLACLICLNTEDLANFWTNMPSKYPPPEFIRLRVADLWRLEAQYGSFLFCPYASIEQIYNFDRILFPNTKPYSGISRAHIYPDRKSNLEILLDQYFMNEQLIKAEQYVRRDNATTIYVRMPTEGFDPDVFPQGLPNHSSWSDATLAEWLKPPQENFFNVLTDQVCKLRVNPDHDLLALAADIAGQITRDLTPFSAYRTRLINWTLEVSTNSLPPDFASEMSTRIARLWDGLRYLPHSDEDIAAGIGMCVAYAVALRGDFRNINAAYWEQAANRIFPDPMEVEFGVDDGSYSRGFVSEKKLLAAVRNDLGEFLAPQYRDQILGNPYGTIQTSWNPRCTFVFSALAPVFAREVAPFQVLMRSATSAIFYSPARLRSLGLP